MSGPAEIVSAGVVVLRNGEVLLVHRPKYDDWSFPKGKAEPGEHITSTAVREVAEETGLDVRLGPPLTSQRYPVGDRAKRVHYWTGRLTGGSDVTAYSPNAEIDKVAWVSCAQAPRLLTYDYDRATLGEARAVRKKSTPLLVLRHGQAFPRKSWEGDDRERPLSQAGEFQAEQVSRLLEAYGVQRIVSSSSRRCWQTMAPYADLTGVELEETEGLAEEDATPATVSGIVRPLLDADEPAVLCTHRPVLPLVFAAIGVPDRALEPGELVVVHHRRGEVVALEQHDS